MFSSMMDNGIARDLSRTEDAKRHPICTSLLAFSTGLAENRAQRCHRSRNATVTRRRYLLVKGQPGPNELMLGKCNHANKTIESNCRNSRAANTYGRRPCRDPGRGRTSSAFWAKRDFCPNGSRGTRDLRHLDGDVGLACGQRGHLRVGGRNHRLSRVRLE